eukprot:scaffold7364_cov130-Isochrysis_galbana.AAC.6
MCASWPLPLGSGSGRAGAGAPSSPLWRGVPSAAAAPVQAALHWAAAAATRGLGPVVHSGLEHDLLHCLREKVPECTVQKAQRARAQHERAAERSSSPANREDRQPKAK